MNNMKLDHRLNNTISLFIIVIIKSMKVMPCRSWFTAL